MNTRSHVMLSLASIAVLLCSACRGPLAPPPTTPTSVESAPMITQVVPPFGLASGGTGIRIDGMWFKEGATLTIGGVPAVQTSARLLTSAAQSR